MSFLFGSFESVQDDFSTNYTPLEAIECCGASTARCHACKQGITEEEYCEANPSAFGCESQPDAQQSMFDRDGWTSSESLLRTTNASDRRVKRNAMASATTEEDLSVAITEAKAAGVSHIVIRHHQRRLDSMRGDETHTIESRRQRYEDELGVSSHTSTQEGESGVSSHTSTQGTQGGSFNTHTSASHSSHSFTGRDCSMLRNINRRACFFGYTNVRTYCQSEGHTDPTCKTYIDSSEYTDGYRPDRERPNYDAVFTPPPPPPPPPLPPSPPPNPYDSPIALIVGIGFLLIVVGVIAYKLHYQRVQQVNSSVRRQYLSPNQTPLYQTHPYQTQIPMAIPAT